MEKNVVIAKSAKTIATFLTTGTRLHGLYFPIVAKNFSSRKMKNFLTGIIPALKILSQNILILNLLTIIHSVEVLYLDCPLRTRVASK